MCMREVRAGVSGVTCVYVPATGSAHYGGLMTCGSVWHCPVCAAKITERRRGELHQAVKTARERGLRVVMVTYTFRHSRADDVQIMLGRMLKAFKAYKSGRQAQELHRQFGAVGTVRALEVTYGQQNGWHPHIHELVFLPHEIDVQAFGEAARAAWEHQAARQGLDMNEHGFQLDDCDTRVVDYIAKYGHEPQWDEAAEVSKWHMKRGRGDQLDEDEHVTPFGLLRYSLAGDMRAGSLFVAYAQAFKGRRQLVWSPGLRELLDLDQEQTDEEIAEEQREQGIDLIMLDRQVWAIVVGNGARGDLLEVVRTGDVLQVEQFLQALGAPILT